MIEDFITELGGRDAVAALCGITSNAVYKWSAGSDPGIPMKHWPKLRAASGGRFSFEDFERINSQALADRSAADPDPNAVRGEGEAAAEAGLSEGANTLTGASQVAA